MNPEGAELDRILQLPCRHPVDAEEAEIVSMETMRQEAFDAGERLRPVQVWALREWFDYQGALLPVGVGGGKSGIALMAAQDALSRRGARRVALMMPVPLVDGFLRRHLPEWRRRVNLPATVHNFKGKSRAGRMGVAKNGAPGIFLFPYSLLSTSDTVDVLRELDADVVVADEAHYLKNPRSACTKRLMAYLAERAEAGRPVRFVGMSGTICSRSIMEYHHLTAAALGDLSPLPRGRNMAYSWSMVLDSGAAPPPGMAKTVLGPLLRWAEVEGVGTEAYRAAFRKRFTTAPGIVTSGDERLPTSLRIQNLPERQPGDALKELCVRVSKGFVTPQGEPIDHAFHVYKWMSELSCGFYNSLVWPTPEELARGRRIEVAAAESLLKRAREYLRAEQDLHSELREFFEGAPAGMDTPREVGRSMEVHGSKYVGELIYELWRRRRSLDFPGRPERRSVPVRVDDFKVRDVVAWGKEHGRGLVYTHHHEMAEWCVEALAAAGCDPLYCPAGADREIESVGDPMQGGKGDRLVVASVQSHGVGRNLQAFDRALYAQWTRGDVMAEQSLGRFHRSGQQADEVVAYTMMWTPWDHQNRGATLVDAEFVFQTTGTEQRVLYADYDPLPTVYPPSLLAAQGMAPKSLDPSGLRNLERRFGQ